MARYYEEEFKRQIVELKISGRKTADLVKEYGVSKTTITQWEKEFKNSGKFGKKVNITEEEKELKQLRKELKQLRMENDILKQAALIFSKESK